MNKHQIMRAKRIQEDTNANATIESLSMVAWYKELIKHFPNIMTTHCLVERAGTMRI